MENMVIGITDCSKFQQYKEWIEQEPGVRVIHLSYQLPDETNHCDGLVLTGGTDIHPRMYKSGKVDYAGHPGRFEEERDSFETNVFEWHRQKEIPLLAICRGFQLVNCILGGSLIQDLGENQNLIHNSEYKDLNPSTKIDKAHGVSIIEGTMLKNITGVERSVVNSAHHQAIDRVADELRINCISDDGVVEGLERKENANNPFLLSVQWHPERMSRFQLQDAPLSKNIRHRFLQEVRKNKRID
ncbi:MAG: hypothetical protein C5B59_10940 [Bacteroidetes bacterium]|nr:MAG: hypothetical protein C5B59_10940 [Bacteroidota bacterium]